MLTKWKTLITNWINCYLNDTTDKTQAVDLESLLNIITHLRSNVSLDESKSSIIEAHTLEEFIAEKYPNFTFENGSNDLSSEDNLFTVASLLLYFVCVTSKDVDMKNLMCSNLSADDQKLILKFNRSLMEFETITHKEIYLAIKESCMEATPSSSRSLSGMVAQTPPAVRSLHGEVRRLHAALDAERFDRNYLQEELTRTQHVIEKLLKDKDQYKQDILNLKAKLSVCGGDSEAPTEGAKDTSTKKFLAQIDELEQRLVDTRAQIDELVYERDTYKKKVDELKQERDKWLSFGQQEATRANQLEEQLDVEKRTVESLKEIVTELRQHNKHNGLDGSQLECDDPDTSMQSFRHNLSICNEACVNVVEVQLAEERVKVVELKQQIQNLQDQIHGLNEKTEQERLSYNSIVLEKESDIMELKHRVNEEIEDKDNLKAHFSNEITKLNNEINELEQKIRENNEHYSHTIETKIKDIQTLQEEKCSLLKSFSDETNKLSNIIKSHESTIENLEVDLNTERNNKQKMRDDYELKVMKLNEKVSNRNNEVVELQNKIVTNGETIEKIQGELRTEKQIKNELNEKLQRETTKCNALEVELTEKTETITELTKAVDENNNIIENLNSMVDTMKSVHNEQAVQLQSLNEKCEKLVKTINDKEAACEEKGEEVLKLQNMLSDQKDAMTKAIENLSTEVESLKQNKTELNKQLKSLNFEKEDLIKTVKVKETNLETSGKHIDELIKTLSEQKYAMSKVINEKQAEIVMIKEKLQTETTFNTELQIELAQLKETRNEMAGELNKQISEYSKLNEDYKLKSQTIDKMDLYLQEEKTTNEKLKTYIDNVNKTVNNLSKQLSDKEECVNKQNETIHVKDEEIKILKVNAEREIAIKLDLEKQIEVLDKEKTELLEKLKSNEEELLTLNQTIDDKTKAITNLEEIQEKELQKYRKLETDFNTETSNLLKKLNETQKSLKDLHSTTNRSIEERDINIQRMSMEVTAMEQTRIQDNQKIELLHREQEAIIQKLEEETAYRNKLEKEYQNKCMTINDLTEQFNNDVLLKQNIIQDLEEEVKRLCGVNKEKCEEIKTIKNRLQNEIEAEKKIIKEKDEEITKLSNTNEQLQEDLKRETQSKIQAIEALRKEKEQLMYTLEEDNSNHEVLLKEKDSMLESLQKDYEQETLMWEKLKFEMKENLDVKHNKITRLEENLAETKTQLDLNLKRTETLKQDYEEKLTELNKQHEEILTKLTSENNSLKETVTMDEDKYNELKYEKEVLLDQVNDEKQSILTLHKEMQNLVSEKNLLSKQFSEHENLVASLRKDRENLITKMNNDNEQLTKVITSKEAIENANKILTSEKEVLTQQLIEEKSEKNVVLKEKEALVKAKTKLNKKLEKEKAAFTHLMKEKENVKQLNQTLLQKMADEKAIRETLVHEKEVLINEKELLVNNLSIEKAAKDEVESEKGVQAVVLEEMKQKHLVEIDTIKEELTQVSNELNSYKSDYNDTKAATEKFTSTLSQGLNKLMNSLKNEDIKNEILKKLISMDNYEQMAAHEQCDLVINIADTLTTELAIRKNLEKALEHENVALTELRECFQKKDMQLHELQTEYKTLQQSFSDVKAELSKQHDAYINAGREKDSKIQRLQKENELLHSELGDVKFQLEVKAHSWKEKLTDNENLTDKLKKSYECQIENLNLISDKLTSYLKDKTMELEAARVEKEKLLLMVDECNKTIRTLEEEVKLQKQNQEKLITDFESERLVFKNMVTVTESVMDDQKSTMEKTIAEHEKANQNLTEEIKAIKEEIESEKENHVEQLKKKDVAIEKLLKEVAEEKVEKEALRHDVEQQMQKKEMMAEEIQQLRTLVETLDQVKKDFTTLTVVHEQLTTEKVSLEMKFIEIESQFSKERDSAEQIRKDFEKKNKLLEDKMKQLEDMLSVKEKEIKDMSDKLANVQKEREDLMMQIKVMTKTLEDNTEKANKHMCKVLEDNMQLGNINEENRSVIKNQELLIKHELQENQRLREYNASETLNLVNKCTLLEQYQEKAEIELTNRDKEIAILNAELKALKAKLEQANELEEKLNEKDIVISTIGKELSDKTLVKEKLETELKMKTEELCGMKKVVEELGNVKEALGLLKKENEELFKAVGQRETLALVSQEKSSSSQQKHSHSGPARDHQVDMSYDSSHTSTDTKTIADLEKIIHDKNRTITALQSDSLYLKTLLGDSENKLLDTSKELQAKRDECEQLAAQLKKIVTQKNEELGDLKKQVSKMSVTENRASQIIKVSAKYQAIILKRIAEIKTSAVLKELTNFGNANAEGDGRKSMAGSVTMEELESFLETTDRHLRRGADRQAALQKERDRLIEVKRINEAEIVNLKKFLTELSVSVKTFNSLREMYASKMSRVVGLQRTVRREVLSGEGQGQGEGEGRQLERGYAAALQDLAECALHVERWAERCVGRLLAPEKIRQAFASNLDRASMAGDSFQNAGLEVQLDELEAAFARLLAEAQQSGRRAAERSGQRGGQPDTVAEVRAEYEDKLNRMKAKMKQLYQEQIGIFREKQKEEIAALERELQKAKEKLTESSRAYEEHIRGLTTELWNVGEKFLIKKDEADWLRRNKSGSLQSLQHVHSSGLLPRDPTYRPSDACSLRSLPVQPKKNEPRALHMSDEEGEVFDNRALVELSTPRASRAPHPGRLSELQWRNSLCPPHLQSSYPAETQFIAAKEDDIKCANTFGKSQRKEVGITAYKKPGPPTPSKQAGRLSATDSELRESLRAEPEPRKTSTPSRLMALFRNSRSDTNDGTPRTKRLSIFRSKK